ncbi:MAG TPA: amylo-alpha-1,6-glucosidase [Thiobacillaceae bacterium]|nr:amylo-alpha-1,6-glucosidase [Thiobacillaceae bacterium]HNH88979.1 amylo-alpha-1,6-glucosidase [Thiobacillaceae bacterium]
MAPDLPDFIRFGRDICGDLEQAERREWWLANGLGAYAAGTVAGSLTRRYHGLLVAPVDPPLGRRLVLAKADATLIDGERHYPLHVNRWAGGAVEPRGHVHIESFRLEGGMAVWIYAIGDIRLEQRIWMEHGAHATYVAWCLAQPVGRPLRLTASLLVNNRDHHGGSQPGAFDPDTESTHGRLEVRAPGFSLHLRAPGGRLLPCRHWVENFHLPVEAERGLPDMDHHLCVGRLELDLGSECRGLVASLGEVRLSYPDEARRRRHAHDLRLLKQAALAAPEIVDGPDWVKQLVLAADTFLFARPLPDLPEGESVIAGYPWFGDWGRDTMIALPGLTLATGRLDSARRILTTFARFVDRGMLPNVFPGAGETPDYNTVDAGLWYFEAWRAYVEASGDLQSLRAVFPVLADMVDWHVKGSRHGIGLDPADGLLRAGEPGVQLTWMDAKLGDWVVTPRIGKPVEINALWFNALRAMADFASMIGRDPKPYRQRAEAAGHGFQRFLKPEGGLFDVLDGPGGDDPTLRPNQILAVSLPHTALDRAAQARVVAEVGRELLTSVGLRSLAPDHPDYRGRYLGGVWERDSSYHQGPVWAWLLPHYALAEFRVTGDAARAQSLLAPLGDHLRDAALGSISEIFDGDAPHTPRGAPSQAWSVACALEAWLRLERAKAAGAVRAAA